jgi:hypothetical protein
MAGNVAKKDGGKCGKKHNGIANQFQTNSQPPYYFVLMNGNKPKINLLATIDGK